MHAQNLVIDQSCDRHAVEDILELLPDTDGVAALALIVKAIDSVNLTTLVITSQEEEVLLEFDLVGQKQDYGL